MPLLRFVMLFSFAALSIARAATCSDFQIFANGITIKAPPGNSSVNYPIEIGDNLEFTLSPVGDIIQWILSGVIAGDGPSYSPPISVATTGNIAGTKVLKVKNCNVEKTINIMLWAIYTITFDPQGGDVSVLSKPVKYDTPVGTMPTPARKGYDFSGWYTTAASGGAKYTDTTVYRIPSHATFFARWIAKTYTLNFNANSPDGNVSTKSKSVTFDKPVGTLPTPTRTAHIFKGWYSAEETEYTAATVYKTDGPTTLYAKWEFETGTRPKIGMLDFTIPTGLVYNGTAITSLPTVKQKSGTYGTLGDRTILYDGKNTPPKNAGTYAISVLIKESVDYDSATISLGSMTIAKAPATSFIDSAVVKSKIYDAKTNAEIENVKFKISLYPGDAVSTSDYSVKADFTSPNAGTGIAVNGTVSWLANGPLSKNYIISPSPLTFTTTADITRATGELRIIDPRFDLEPPFYEYTEEHTDPIVYKNSFIPNGVIEFEYKKDGDSVYSIYPPNRIGWWFVRATLPETANYTGAEDLKFFRVTRGSARPVMHRIEFSEDYFTEDSALSDKLRAYYVANLCEIKGTTIKITIIGEPDIVLKSEPPHKQGDENLGYYYEIDFPFGKPGLDTLFYTLISTDNIYSENDTLLIETPIPFDSVIKQKWNNVIFINNNDTTNGGYKFTDFKWFKNNSAVSNLQFHSEGPRSTDILNPSDIYKVTMHTKEGIRISTCEGSPKIKILPAAEKTTTAKQVLGINGKTAKPEQKVYDFYGAQRKNTPAGVYIVKDK